MKKTKANMIKILAAMRENASDCAKWAESDGDKIFAARLRAEAQGLQEAIWIISNYNNSFESYGAIYFPDDFPNK